MNGNVVRLTVMGESRIVDSNSTLLELAKDYQHLFRFPIIATKVNNQYQNIRDKVLENTSVEYFDLSDRGTNRIYCNGLIYLTIYAIVNLYGNDSMVNVMYSVDKGLYLTLNFNIEQEDIIKIKNKMREVVLQDLPIEKVSVRRLEAIDYFKANKLDAKAGILSYSTNTFITLYKLGHMFDFFFSELPPSTGYLNRFDLVYLNENGFVLLYPTNYLPDKIKPYVHHEKLFSIFSKYENRAKILNVSDVTDLNNLVVRGRVDELIRLEEAVFSSELINLAEAIYHNSNKAKVILLAGPSCSGKTTTSIRLGNYLKNFGLCPQMISMDDYFVNREDTPKLPNGDYDFECLEAVNLERLESDMGRLLQGEEIILPKYNFIKGASEDGMKMKLNGNDIIIIEGIHALNPQVLPNIDKQNKFKLYVCPTTVLSIDNHNRIPTTDNRLLRRIVRDARTRGYEPETTIKNWDNIRRGEEKNIFPFQDEADYILNTSFLYEMGVLSLYAIPLLYTVKPDSIYYEEAKRLINLLKNFLPVSSEAVPKDSHIREFIGGSCYKVD